MPIEVKTGTGVGSIAASAFGSQQQLQRKELVDTIYKDKIKEQQALDLAEHQSILRREEEDNRYRNLNMKTEAERQRLKNEYQSRRSQIDTAFREGKINAKARDAALMREEKRYPEVAEPWFSEDQQEDDPVWESPEGEKIPLGPEKFEAWKESRKYKQEEIDKQKKIQDAQNKKMEKYYTDIARGEAMQKEMEAGSPEAVRYIKNRVDSLMANGEMQAPPSSTGSTASGPIMGVLDAATGGLASKGINGLNKIDKAVGQYAAPQASIPFEQPEDQLIKKAEVRGAEVMGKMTKEEEKKLEEDYSEEGIRKVLEGTASMEYFDDLKKIIDRRDNSKTLKEKLEAQRSIRSIIAQVKKYKIAKDQQKPEIF